MIFDFHESGIRLFIDRTRFLRTTGLAGSYRAVKPATGYKYVMTGNNNSIIYFDI